MAGASHLLKHPNCIAVERDSSKPTGSGSSDENGSAFGRPAECFLILYVSKRFSPAKMLAQILRQNRIEIDQSLNSSSPPGDEAGKQANQHTSINTAIR